MTTSTDGLFPAEPVDPVLPTEGEIAAARTPAGGWTRAQLAQWGVPWPPPSGWKQELVERSRAACGDG